METTKCNKEFLTNTKNLDELSTVLASPGPFNERSSHDFSSLSNANTSIQMSPMPKSRLLDTSFSPLISKFSPSDKRSPHQLPRPLLALEEKLMKIEQDHKSTLHDGEEDKSFSIQQPPKPTVYAEEYEEDYNGKGNSEIPTLMWCANCKGEMATGVVYVNNSKTFWSSVGIFLSGGVLGCFLLPYCTNYCKSVQVVCTKCGRVVG